MINDKYKLKNKSDVELREWVSKFERGTSEYIAGIQESMRRVAVIEELMERTEEPVLKRERIAFGVAIMLIMMSIIVTVVTN